MKKITNLLMLLTVVLFAACDETVDTPDTLEVKPYNIEGVWMLAEQSGSALADSAYVYLVLDRRYSFELYDNTQSRYPVLFTGKYSLEYDWRVGDVISGTYDYDLGAWSHEYVITELREQSMTWTAKDDASYVQEYVRVPEVPTEILEAVRRDE